MEYYFSDEYLNNKSTDEELYNFEEEEDVDRNPLNYSLKSIK